MKLKQIESIIRPESQSSEAYRMLETSLELSFLDKEIKAIMVTSAGFQEGKTYTALNLAVQMAQSGKKTIIVDCHQRKPDLHKNFRLSNDQGLSDIILNGTKFQDIVKATTEENLYVLVAGSALSNSSKLFNSLEFKTLIGELKGMFDFIILDSPPVIVGADTQIISKNIDGCILVVAPRNLDREVIIKAKELLDKMDTKILGVVLNKVEVNTTEYYKYYRKNRKTK